MLPGAHSQAARRRGEDILYIKQGCLQLGFRRGGHGRRRHLGGLRLLFLARQQLIHTHLQRGSQLRQGGDVRQAKAALPLAYRLVRHAQCVCKLLLCHIQRLAAGRHKSAYFFAIHSNASFWCAARCIHNAGPRCLACLLYHTPPGGATHGLWRPCLRSVERAVPRQGPPIPAKCRPGGAPVFTGQVHMALQTKGTISPHGNPIAAMGAFHAFPTRCKTVCGCPWPQKFRRLFFVQPARLQSDDGSAFASRGQPGNLGQATA